jgi:hypothetical protein
MEFGAWSADLPLQNGPPLRLFGAWPSGRYSKHTNRLRDMKCSEAGPWIASPCYITFCVAALVADASDFTNVGSFLSHPKSNNDGGLSLTLVLVASTLGAFA